MATVLITGATGGIGRAAAMELARAGHEVIASGRSVEALERLAREAAAAGLGDRLRTVRLDVADADSVEAARREVDALLGGRGLDVLVNNAGYSQPGPLELVDDAALRRQFDTNVFGLMAVTRAFLPGMRANGGGRIVNVSSIMGRLVLPFHGAYNASKYAVEALSDALRMELAPLGIDVILVEPGGIRSGFGERAIGNLSGDLGAGTPYAKVLARAASAYERIYRLAPGPELVAHVIRTAIEAPRPRPRYVDRRSSRLLLVASATTPTRLLDALMRLAFGYRPARRRTRASSPSVGRSA